MTISFLSFAHMKLLKLSDLNQGHSVVFVWTFEFAPSKARKKGRVRALLCFKIDT